MTVLEVMEGIIEIQSSAGDVRLGGEDFTRELETYATQRLELESKVRVLDSGVPAARLREACEAAKRRLSTEAHVELALTAIQTSRGMQDVMVGLDRSEIEPRFEALLERMRSAIRRALRDARRDAGQIDEVLLVGGATRMPCIERLAHELFGRPALRSLPPDEAVALGAAVQAALRAGDRGVGDLIATDVAPFSLGIATASLLERTIVQGEFCPILERGTVLPASRVQRLQTLVDHQRELRLEVFQGEHSLCSENQLIAQYLIKDIPYAPSGRECVDVRFTYDLNGVLDIDVTIVSTGAVASFTVDRNELSKEELERTRARLARLKFHPREALPNIAALSRADALYVELLSFERERLGAAISNFRLALQTQDPKLISEQRNALIELTRALSARRSGET